MKKISSCLLLLVISHTVAAKNISNSQDQNSTKKTEKKEIEVAFSPNEQAEELVMKTIYSAKSSIRLASYYLTSSTIADALIDAKKSGIDVAVVSDYKANMLGDRTDVTHQSFEKLIKSGIPIRTVNIYPIHHDKYIIVDGAHVETGSFNYTKGALKNSENVLVVWNDPKLADQYLKHWQSQWDQGEPALPAN